MFASTLLYEESGPEKSLCGNEHRVNSIKKKTYRRLLPRFGSLSLHRSRHTISTFRRGAHQPTTQQIQHPFILRIPRDQIRRRRERAQFRAHTSTGTPRRCRSDADWTRIGIDTPNGRIDPRRCGRCPPTCSDITSIPETRHPTRSRCCAHVLVQPRWRAIRTNTRNRTRSAAPTPATTDRGRHGLKLCEDRR